MEDWKKLVSLLDKFNCDAQYVAECVYSQVAKEFYDLFPAVVKQDEKFMDELQHFMNE